MKLNDNEIQELKLLLQDKYISVQKHPVYELFIYKYTPNAVFEKKWIELTMRMRGMVLDNDYNIIANCMPKFFNYDELEVLGISLPNEDYVVTKKMDGSLIEVFRYKGKIIVSSAGSFSSPQSIAAENMLKTKYSHLLEYIEEGKTYIFELIF